MVAVVLAVSAFAQAPANSLLNPGFEAADARGLPSAWSALPDGDEGAGVMALDRDVKRSGAQSLRIRHERADSYSKLRQSGVAVKRDTDYTASVWLRIADPLETGIEQSHGARLLVFGKGAQGERPLGHAVSVLTTRGAWQRSVVRFNTGECGAVSVLIYLHNARGSVWVDDAELVEGREPSEAAEPASAFPDVDFMPGTAALQRAFYLMQGEPAALTLFYAGDGPAAAKGLELVLDMPEDVVVARDFASGAAPSFVPAPREGRRYHRCVLPVSAERIHPKSFRHAHKHGHILVLEASGAPRGGESLYWRFRRGDALSEERRLALHVLPAPPPLGAVPSRFDILTFYSAELRHCPEGAEGDRLFDRIHQLHVKAGLRGGVAPPIGAERTARLLNDPAWASGVLSGFPVALGDIMSADELREAQAVDAKGKPFAGVRPCPTFCHERNVMERLARLQHGRSPVSKPGAPAPKAQGWHVLDFEPGREMWSGCCCARCLDAFAAHAGLARDTFRAEDVSGRLRPAWTAFRDAQRGRIVGQFRDAVRALEPALRFGFCDDPMEALARPATQPFVDFYCPMIYYLHPRKFFDVVEEERQRIQKPFLPTIEAKMLGYTSMTSPAEMKLKILTAAATGAEGIMIWPDTLSLSALDLAKIRESSDALAALEACGPAGPREDGAFRVWPADKGFVHHGYRARACGQGRLLTLFNFHSTASVSLSVAALAGGGDARVVDPVSKTAFLAPATGARVWRPADVAAGFSIELPPQEAAFVLVKPASEADDSQRTRALRPAVSGGGGAFRVRAGRLASAPEVDGALGGAAWGAAGKAEGFTLAEAPAPEQTAAFAAYDDACLYVAFECQEPLMAEVAAQHTRRDSDVWLDDCVELFLRPRPGESFHFIVNAAGGFYDARRALDGVSTDDAKWDSQARWAAAKGASSWTVEVAIPFACLGGAPKPGDVWGVNFCRSRVAGFVGRKYNKDRQASSWFPTFGAFANPPRFGELEFGE